MLRLLLVAFAALALAGPALAGWKLAETAHFRVYSDGSEARLTEQAAVLEDFRSLLIRMTGRQPVEGSPKLDVFLVDRLAEATPWRAMEAGVAGFYRADVGRISAVAVDRAAAGRLDIGAQQILLHEVAHHFMLGAAGPAYPAWYVEGFAEYYSTVVFRPDRIEYGLGSGNRMVWLANAPWLPLDRVLRGEVARNSRDSAMFYAQSWLLTHHMFRAPGMREKLVAYLKAFAAGTDPVEAFRQHVAADTDAFQRQLRSYLRAKATYSRFDRPAGTPAGVTLTPLSPAADTLLMRMVALEHGIPEASAPAALAEVRTLAAGASPDPLAARTLALAELSHGDAETALRLLDGLLEATPADPALLRWRALAMKPFARGVSPERVSEAKRLLARAFRAAPDDWRTLHAWVRLHKPLAGPLPPQVLDVMLRTHELAPQVSEVVLETAVVLTHVGRLAEAADVLQPLAYAPHGGEASGLAQRMLEKARANDKAGVLEEVVSIAARRSVQVAAAPAAADQVR